MTSLSTLWDFILKNNLFNFAILVAIICFAAYKINIPEKLDIIKNEIIKKIEDSKQAKTDAEKNLSDAQSKIIHLDEEISERINLAEKQADNVAASIQEAANRKLLQLRENVKKVSEAEEKTILTILNDNTAMESVKRAEIIINEKLKKNPELHKKFIEESIEEIKKVSL